MFTDKKYIKKNSNKNKTPKITPKIIPYRISLPLFVINKGGQSSESRDLLEEQTPYKELEEVPKCQTEDPM